MMEQVNNPDSGAATLPEQTRMPSVGQRLREARERHGLSVDDVIAKIKLAPRQIIALEADDFQALPETAFVRGFVRSYARLLQLDAQSLLDDLPGAQVAKIEVNADKVEAPFPSERTARRQNLNLLIGALLITVVIAGFAVWQVNAPVKTVEAPTVDAAMVETPLPLPEQVEVLDESGVPDAASAVPEAVVVQSAVPATVPAVVPATAAPKTEATVAPKSISVLRLTFDKDAWVDIRDKYGKPLTNHLNRSGTELSVEGIAPFALVVGHANSVHLYYGDKQVDMTPYVNAGSEVARLTVE
jgi:cytoskeleton protein RodZ